MKFFLLIFLIFAQSISASSQTITLTDYINNLQKEELDEGELKGILLMREEEKLARDVYEKLFEKWNAKIFQSIANSEKTHMDLVKVILDKYNIADPMKTEIGIYENEHLTELYNLLVTSGYESIEKAYFVGATIEDLDISDLIKLASESSNNDIKTVYQNLLLGSRNHLRSFDKNYKAFNLFYIEQFITKDLLSSILNNPSEKGPVDQFGNPLNLTDIEEYPINQNSPTINILANPSVFSNYTSFKINIIKPNNVEANIYNINGELVKSLKINQIIGENTLIWDGTSNQNSLAVNGSYYIIIKQENQICAGKVILQR